MSVKRSQEIEVVCNGGNVSSEDSYIKGLERSLCSIEALEVLTARERREGSRERTGL